MHAIQYKTEDWSKKSMKLTICGMGYTNIAHVDRKAESYIRWHDMINRCYNDKFHDRQPQYRDCEVCKEWLSYSNFKNWYDNNVYYVEGEQMDLDKDILYKENKTYSSETCCIVPHGINALILNCKKSRGDLPLGVWHDKADGRYRISMSCHGELSKKGSFKTAEEAFIRYKTDKEKFLKNIAEEYRGRIPDKVYEAIKNWKIEATD